MKCKECQSKQIQSLSNGELVCRICGFVLEDQPFSQEVIPEGVRTALPGMDTAGTFTAEGRIVKQSWLLSKKQRNIRSANFEIELLSSHIKAPESVTKEAKRLFVIASQKDLLQGRDTESFAYASVYLACLVLNIPKTIQEILFKSNLNRRRLFQAIKSMQKHILPATESIDPLDLIPRFSSRLRLLPKTVTLANDLLIKMSTIQSWNSIQPATKAAVALYIASKISGEYRTQREVCNSTGIIEVTLRKRSRELREQIDKFKL